MNWNWKKMGLCYNAHDHQLDWAKNSALTPTPLLINNDILRIYFAARDEFGVSRIRYVDLNANNPNEILSVATKPALDVGRPGSFDDNGVILGDILLVNKQYYMFYVGFQLVEKVKFLAFTGLAISNDGGINFIRYGDAPLLDRSNEGIYIRAIHSVLYENNKWKIWYAAGNKWTAIDDRCYPNYEIKYLESDDLFILPKQGSTCIQQVDNEYRIGRPRVYKTNQGYCMFYTKGAMDQSYKPGIAFSNDGVSWQRKDELVGITLSNDGWDAKTLCYPSMIRVPSGKTYLFYNGNNMGHDGFGYAELNDLYDLTHD